MRLEYRDLQEMTTYVKGRDLIAGLEDESSPLISSNDKRWSDKFHNF